MLRSRSFKLLVVLTLVFLLVLGFGTVLAPASGGSPGRSAMHLETPPASEPAPAGIERVDERWTMQDGITLPVSVLYPPGEGSVVAYPVIVFIHPWDCDKTFFEEKAKEYAAEGYVCVLYTVRGWYDAEGQIACMDPAYEIHDLSEIITLVSEDERFPVLWDEKGPVVGVAGYSMGGCISFLIAPRKDPRPGDPGDPRVRAVVPMHGGSDILFSIMPNGAAKALWGVFLVGFSYAGNLAGFMMSAISLYLRTDLGAWQKLYGIINAFWKIAPGFNNVTPMLMWATGTAMERRMSDIEAARQYLRERSARYWCDEEYDGVVEHPITAPTLILAGWNDDIFYANEGLRTFSTCMDAPARMIITNHGHIGGIGDNSFIPFPGTPEFAWLSEQVEMWFDHYLKGEDNGVENAPRLSFYRDRAPADYGEADAYPLPGTVPSSLYLGASGAGGKLTPSAPRSGEPQADLLINIGITGSVSLPYYQDVTEMLGGETMKIPTKLDFLEIPFTERSYITAPLAEDVTIMGVPKMEYYYQCSAQFTQLIPWVYEVAPDGTETLISRGFYEGYNPSTWTICSTAGEPVEMQACYHRFPKGSRIKLEISTADLLMTWPHFGLAFIQLFHRPGAASRLILPTVPNSY